MSSSEASNPLLEGLQNALFAGQSQKAAVDEAGLLPACLDVTTAVVTGTLPIAVLVQMLKEWKSGVGDVSSQMFTSCIMSSLWIVGTQSKTMPSYSPSNLASLVKELISLGLVDAVLLKSTLELQTLADCGLIRDAEQPVQRIIKINTGLVYKQQKYNLLREETEGYSKLLMALVDVSSRPEDCQIVIDSVRTIIGQFDLDPNRTFDIILDCFEQHPKNVSYLAILSALKPVNLVHTLGFKFSHYHAKSCSNTTASDNQPLPPAKPANANSKPSSEEEKSLSNDVILYTPNSLLAVAATLIVSGLVSMQELLPYLDPIMEETAKYVIEKENEILKIYNDSKFDAKLQDSLHFFQKDLSMRKGTTWQLGKPPVSSSSGTGGSMAGSSMNSTSNPSLTSSSSSKNPPPPPPALTVPSGKDTKPAPVAKDRLKEKEKDKAPEEEDLHLNEFTYFACGNHIQAAQIDETKHQILGLISSLLQVHGWEQAKSLMLSLQGHGVQPDSLLLTCPSIRRELLNFASWSLDSVYTQCNRICGTLCGSDSSKHNSDDTQVPGIVFERFQQIYSFENDFFSKGWEIIQLLGIHIADHSLLFTKLCRLLTSWIAEKIQMCQEMTTEQKKESFLNHALKLMLLLLQNLCVSGVDSTYFASQLWQSISLLNFEDRFALYEVWKEASDSAFVAKYKQLLGIKMSQSFALLTTRREMKRLTKETSKQIGQKLAKFMHANPLVFIDYMLSQVENFDNLIPYVIEALRFSTDLSRDVFAFSILAHLNKKIDDRKIKDADTHYYPWFIAISKFVASFYCKFAGTEIRGLLHYLLKCFSNGRAADLLILKDLLGIMGGSTTLLELSHAQLDGLAGGKHLRGEAMGLATSVTMSGGKSTALSTKKSAVILRDELISSRVALPLLLFIAQMRSNVIYESSNSHLKLISFFFDNVQDLLMQFADFLIGEAKSIEVVAQLMPPFKVLLDDIGLSLPVAFQLVRPLMRNALQQQGSSNSLTSSWLPFDENLQMIVRSRVSSHGLWEVLSIRFYMLFWSLSLYDISVPTDKYQYEIKRIKDKYAELDRKKATTTAQSLNISEGEFAKWRKQREADMKQMMITVAALSEELLNQKKHVDQIKELLSSGKDTLIASGATNVCHMILQHCILPRVMMSPADAVFCVRFCKVLFEMEIPNFCLLEFYDGFVSLILPLLFAATETEAKVIGHALNEILAVVNRWRKGSSVFQLDTKSKCFVFSGSTETSTSAATAASAEATKPTTLSHKKFVDMTKLWHSKILDVVYNAINGKEFIYIRTALIFLTKVSPQFPYLKSEGNRLLQRVQKLEKDENERGDLQLLAKSVLIILKQTSGLWFDDEPKNKTTNSTASKSSATTNSNSKNSSTTTTNVPGSSDSSKNKNDKPISNKMTTAVSDDKSDTIPTKGNNNSNKSWNTSSSGSGTNGNKKNEQPSTSNANTTNTSSATNVNNANKSSEKTTTSSNVGNSGTSNSGNGGSISSDNSNRKNQNTQPSTPTSSNNVPPAAQYAQSSTKNSTNTTASSTNASAPPTGTRDRSSSKQRASQTSTQHSAGSGNTNGNPNPSSGNSNSNNNNKRKAGDNQQTEGLPPMKVPRQQQQAGNSTGTTIANKDEGQVNDQRKDDSKKGSNSTNQSANQNKKDEGQAKKAAVDAKKEDASPVSSTPRQDNSRNASSKATSGNNQPPSGQPAGQRGGNNTSKGTAPPPPPPPPPAGPPPAPQLSVHTHMNFGSGRNNYAPPPMIPPHQMGGGYNSGGGRYNDGRDYDGYDGRGDYESYDPYRSRQDYDYNRRPAPNNSNNGGNYRQQDHPDHYYKKPRN